MLIVLCLGCCLLKLAIFMILFSNIYYLMQNKNKILILDWDIHFADGTESLFREDKNVMLISLHRYPYFPEIHVGGYGDARNIGSGMV